MYIQRQDLSTHICMCVRAYTDLLTYHTLRLEHIRSFTYCVLNLVIEPTPWPSSLVDKLLEVAIAAALVTIPLTNPLSAGMITILIDSLPLPTRVSKRKSDG